MRISREPKGYGMVGVSWCFGPFGKTIVLSLAKVQVTWHRRDREMESILDRHIRERQERAA